MVEIMNRYQKFSFVSLLIVIFIAASGVPSSADDTCMFAVTADQVPPNIVILLDNGAEMQQVVWHSAYDNGIDFTPGAGGEEYDVVKNMGSGSGFFHDNGYGIVEHGDIYYLVMIRDDLQFADYSTGIMTK